MKPPEFDPLTKTHEEAEDCPTSSVQAEATWTSSPRFRDPYVNFCWILLKDHGWNRFEYGWIYFHPKHVGRSRCSIAKARNEKNGRLVDLQRARHNHAMQNPKPGQHLIHSIGTQVTIWPALRRNVSSLFFFKCHCGSDNLSELLLGPKKMVIRRVSHVLFTKLRNNSVETCWITPNSRHWWPEGSKPKDGQCWPIKYTSLWVWCFFTDTKIQWLRNEATESHSAEVVFGFFFFFFDLIKWSAKLTDSKTCLIKIVWHTVIDCCDLCKHLTQRSTWHGEIQCFTPT